MIEIRLSRPNKTIKIVNRKDTIRLKREDHKISLKRSGGRGPAGEGIPDGGTDGQVISLEGGEPTWVTPVFAPVQSVNGKQGTVVLDADDVDALERPIVDGEDGQYLMSHGTDTDPTWEDVPNPHAEGPTGAVQFVEDDGSFGGSANLEFDKSQSSLKIAGGTGLGVTLEVGGSADMNYLFVGSNLALDYDHNATLGNINASGDILASGNVTGQNLSGTNTGDQDLSGYVTLTGIETLTNKTLTAPVINNPTGFLTGAAHITVATTAPVSPSIGDMWVDSN